MDRFEPYTLFRTSHCTTVLGNPGYLPRRILALGRVVTVAGCNIECSAPLPSSVSLVNHRSPDTTPVAMHGPGYAAERPSMTHSRLEVIVAWILAAYSKTEVGDSSEAALQTDRHPQSQHSTELLQQKTHRVNPVSSSASGRLLTSVEQLASTLRLHSPVIRCPHCIETHAGPQFPLSPMHTFTPRACTDTNHIPQQP